MKPRTFIFDLDGTLIDSANSILASIYAAFTETGIEPIRPLTSELIGPPLIEILKSTLRPEDCKILPIIIDKFKYHYDITGYMKSVVYPGVSEMLSEMLTLGAPLYIATNKRIIPARLIIQHLGWETYFNEIYALDFYHPPMPTKTALLKRLCHVLHKNEQGLVYVGDRLEDAEAAHACNLDFLFAAWGYGPNLEHISGIAKLFKPDQIFGHLYD